MPRPDRSLHPHPLARRGDTSLPYRIEYSAAAVNHLRLLTARQRAMAVGAVDEQLTHQPFVETRNRKRMRPNPVAPWELRVGQMRAYYDIVETSEPVVYIRAIGVKKRNQVVIGGEAMDL
jgi:mRNA-degrading endonuclease RelE of RelBE toxin-antitoxin system